MRARKQKPVIQKPVIHNGQLSGAFASHRYTDPPNVHYEQHNDRSGPLVGCMRCQDDVVLEWVTLGMMILCAGCPRCDTAVFIEYV